MKSLAEGLVNKIFNAGRIYTRVRLICTCFDRERCRSELRANGKKHEKSKVAGK